MLSHRIYLNLVGFYGKCRYIYHTWMVWVESISWKNASSFAHLLSTAQSSFATFQKIRYIEQQQPGRSRRNHPLGFLPKNTFRVDSVIHPMTMPVKKQWVYTVETGAIG